MLPQNKFAVVTGASTGIGRATAIALGNESSTVALVARRKTELEKTKGLIEEAGGQAEIFPADLADINSINGLLAQIKSTTRRVDLLVNVAGLWHGPNEVYANKDFEKFDPKIILDTYTVGITAPTLLAHGLIPLMPKGAKIINISGAFENGAKGWLPYYVSKKAIEDFTLGLAEELTEKEIRVNCVSPSDTATEEYIKYFPSYIKDAVSPEEIAKYVVFLCSPKGDKINGEIKIIKKK